MKIYVLTRKTLLLFAVLLLCGALTVPVVFQSVQTSVGTKELPIYSVETNEKKLAITFDCAWNDNDIDDIIRILKENNCPSTFFVTGQWAEKYPDALKKLYDNNHEIAAHSYNHTLYSTLSKDEILADMKKCDEAIMKAISVAPLLVRAPSGDYTNNFILAAKETGRYPIQWDVDSLDWKELTEEEMKKRIFDRVKNGSILLFHNGTKQTASALPGILQALKDEGYQFVRVSDLIYKENYTIDHTGRQFKTPTA